ncbi:MAG: YigZ family protein [Clostridiales bacterium]|nr:YigZ family protein [Clostridiales bacterium]
MGKQENGMGNYLTVAAAAEAEFTEKKSRFIGRICPATCREAADGFIQEMRGAYWDASHHVYAYRLRDGNMQRYSDDGEPQGSAGLPVLEILSGRELVDCAVVVIRYFGGTLLGTGGLVRAYSKGARLAAEAAGIVCMTLCRVKCLRCPYSYYERMLKLLEQWNAVVTDTEYAEEITIHFYLKAAVCGSFDAELTETTGGRLSAPAQGEAYYPVKVSV